MRKWIIGVLIAVTAVGLVAGGAAFAASRTVAPTAAQAAAANAYAPLTGGGMMGGALQDDEGLLGVGRQLRDAMLQAVAKSLNLTPDDLKAKLAAGQSLASIAEGQGVAQADLPALLQQAWSSTLQAAVADGVLTQAQAEWIQQHPFQMRLLAGGMMGAARGGRWMRGPQGWDFGRR